MQKKKKKGRQTLPALSALRSRIFASLQMILTVTKQQEREVTKQQKMGTQKLGTFANTHLGGQDIGQ